MQRWLSYFYRLTCFAAASETAQNDPSPVQIPRDSLSQGQPFLVKTSEATKRTEDAGVCVVVTNRSEYADIYDFQELFSAVELSEEVSESGNHTYKSGARYIGRTQEGHRQGYGTMRWSAAVEYTGNWHDGIPYGEGMMTFKGLSFRGMWSNPKARGTEEVLEARLYGLNYWLQANNEGYCKVHTVWLWYVQRQLPEPKLQTLSDDQLSRLLTVKIAAIRYLLSAAGEAILKQPQDCHFIRSENYIGCVKAGQPHGLGRKTYIGSCFYEGEWVDGVLHGAGVYQWSRQKRRMGFFRLGKLHGLTVLTEKGNTSLSKWIDGQEVAKVTEARLS